MKTINDYAELVKEKHALNKTIAPVETDLTDASRGYHIGEQFIYDGELNKAKAEIAQHDALVLNTNYEPADDLTTQIKNAGGTTDPRLDVFENNIAPVETDETDASKAYQVGEQLILSNILYDVIAPISEHDVITTTGSGANISPAGSISSGIQTLTNQVKDMNNVYGAKNLLPNNAASQTINGVTFTVNDDGSVTANGTAAQVTQFPIIDNFLILKAGNYILSTENNIPTDVYFSIYITGQGWKDITNDANSIEFSKNSDIQITTCRLYIANGVTLSNLTFYPMIRLASITDDTYEPYAKTNQQLTEDTTALLDNLEVNGAVNMLYPNQSSYTAAGLTYTLNEDNSLSVVGTPSEASGFQYVNINASEYVGKTLKFKANPSGKYADGEFYVAVICRATMTSANLLREDLHLGGSYYRDECTFTVPNGTGVIIVGFNMSINATSAINLTYKPMVTLASYNGDYVPYAKSNKELTEELEAEIGNITTLVSTSEYNIHSVKKYGDVCEATVTLKLAEAVSAWTDFIQLPSGFYPRTYTQIVAMKGDYTTTVNLQISPSTGTIQSALALNSGDTIRFTVTYMTA